MCANRVCSTVKFSSSGTAHLSSDSILNLYFSWIYFEIWPVLLRGVTTCLQTIHFVISWYMWAYLFLFKLIFFFFLFTQYKHVRSHERMHVTLPLEHIQKTESGTKFSKLIKSSLMSHTTKTITSNKFWNKFKNVRTNAESRTLILVGSFNFNCKNPYQPSYAQFVWT